VDRAEAGERLSGPEKLEGAERTLVAGPQKRGNGLRLAGLVGLERGV
jgi:hypothetical protein